MPKSESMTISAADIGRVEDIVKPDAPKRPTVFMFRHQRAGIVTSHVFTSRPTDEQIAPIKAECERLHGREGWGLIHEAELMGPKDIPVFLERPGTGATGDNTGAAGAPGPTVSGSGTVTQRE